jgi:putative PIN family toxin of toxin-antitoxin system
MKVVLDANVFISALLSKIGAPYQIVAKWREEAFELLTSEAILEEIDKVLRYPEIAQLLQRSNTELEEFVALLRDEAHVVESKQHLSISPDESDNRYIECAVSGGADFLVTGDKHHLLPLKEYQGVAILSPAAFVALLS